MANDYPLPPHEPPGGWKNQAQWIGNVESWADTMFRMGFNMSDVEKIYQNNIGERFPKNLKNSFLAKNWLFPGADMMYEYDLGGRQKRHFTYNSPETESGKKGPFDWESMSPEEISAANQYFNWRNDPGHEWMLNQAEENPYIAWLNQWSSKFKDPGFTPPNPGKPTSPVDIFGRPGYGPGMGDVPKTLTSPITLPGNPYTGGNTGGNRGNQPKEAFYTPPVSATSLPNMTGYGMALPKTSPVANPNTINPSMTGWGFPNTRRKNVMGQPNSGFYTFGG